MPGTYVKKKIGTASDEIYCDTCDQFLASVGHGGYTIHKNEYCIRYLVTTIRDLKWKIDDLEDRLLRLE